MIPPGEFNEMIETIEGWLGPEEARALFEIATKIDPKTCIVEIGSYRGRSTVALGLGCKESGSKVYAIDPHFVHMAGGFPFGPADNAAFMNNMLKWGVAKWVFPVCLPSAYVCWDHNPRISLLFIDGEHEYNSVMSDFVLFSGHMTRDGIIAFHDSTGGWLGPTEAVEYIVDQGKWEVYDTVGQTKFLKRVT